MNDSTNNTLGPYLSMGPSGQWVQLGIYQGTAGSGTCPGSTCIRSRTSLHMFAEWTDSCATYGIQDLGAPSTPNMPYYLNYTGTAIANCGTAYQWAYRVGSFTNPPVAIKYLRSLVSGPLSMQEIQWQSVNESAPPTYHGLDGSGTANDSYGLHLYVYGTGQWSLWNAASAPNTYVQNLGSPPSWYAAKYWSAFQTHN